MPSTSDLLLYIRQQAEERVVAVYDERLASLQREHASELKRYKEENTSLKKAELELVKVNCELEQARKTIQQLQQRFQQEYGGSMLQLGLHGLLARDNMEQNERLRSGLKRVCDRIAPDMSSQPTKKAILTHRITNQETARIIRGQRRYVDQCDSSPWNYFSAEKKPEFPCANAIQTWTKCRERFPLFCFGVRFTNSAKTDLVPLTREELINKYRKLIDSRDRGSTRAAEELNELEQHGLKNETDLIEKCFFASSTEMSNEIVRIQEEVVKSSLDEVGANEEPIRPEDVGQRYNAGDVTNWFVNIFAPISCNMNFNFGALTDNPSPGTSSDKNK